jgi:hypothetical protein
LYVFWGYVFFLTGIVIRHTLLYPLGLETSV